MNYYQLIFRPDFRKNEFYEGGQTYIFKSELDLKKGDYVVALTRYGYQIAVVYEKNEVEASYSMYGEGIAKIVTKLEGNYYAEIEKKQKLKAIEKILDKKVKEMSKIAKYETLAKYDNSINELLNEYRNLNNDNYVVALPESKNEAEYDDCNDEDIPF